MKNTEYDGYLGPRMSREVQLKRLRNVMECELTDKQREAIVSYYLERKTMSEIARERHVNKSTVCRMIQRAEARMRRCLRY